MPLYSSSETKNLKWIPENWERIYSEYFEYAAWYGNDMEKLSAVYQSRVPGGHYEKALDKSTVIGSALAGDIANYSSNLLFGEAPKVNVDDEETDKRLKSIIKKGGVYHKLIEAAETCAAMGGVVLKIDWDVSLANYPLLSVAQVDNCLPEWRKGILSAVTFHKTILVNDDIYYRLLEKRERDESGNCVIYNGLYKGDEQLLGVPVSLKTLPQTQNMQEEIRTNIPGLLCWYVPNMKPNRKMRGSQLGQSDYASITSLLDAIDGIYTELMQEIELTRARIMVPEHYLEKKGDSYTFDKDNRIFTPYESPPTEDGGIHVSQFDIRVNEYIKSIESYMQRAISAAGYSPVSFGLQLENAGNAASGSSIRIRERKSFITKEKKESYWKPVLEDLFLSLLMVDNIHFNGKNKVDEVEINVEFGDSVEQDLGQVAESLEKLERAESISIDTKVRMIHPEWSEEQIVEEVERIKDEKGLAMPSMDEVLD